MRNNSCPLCRLEKKTHVYFVSHLLAFVDCDTCHIPMFVWADHTMELTAEEENYIECWKKTLFPNHKWRKKQKKIKDHLHWHLIKE